MKKIAFTIRQASQLTGISVSQLYREVNSGNLTLRKVGARSFILDEELKEFLNSRPQYQSPLTKKEEHK